MTTLFPMTNDTQAPPSWSSTRPDNLFKKHHRSDVRAQNPHLNAREITQLLGDMWRQADPATREKYQADSVWQRFCWNLQSPRTLAQRPASERPIFHAPDQSWTIQQLRDFYCVLIGIPPGRRRAPGEHTRLGKNKTEFLATIHRLCYNLSNDNTTRQQIRDLYCLATNQPIGQKRVPNQNSVLGKNKTEMLDSLWLDLGL